MAKNYYCKECGSTILACYSISYEWSDAGRSADKESGVYLDNYRCPECDMEIFDLDSETILK